MTDDALAERVRKAWLVWNTTEETVVALVERIAQAEAERAREEALGELAQFYDEQATERWQAHGYEKSATWKMAANYARSRQRPQQPDKPALPPTLATGLRHAIEELEAQPAPEVDVFSEELWGAVADEVRDWFGPLVVALEEYAGADCPALTALRERARRVGQ